LGASNGGTSILNLARMEDLMDRREPLGSTDGGEARKSIGFGAIHAGSLGLEGARIANEDATI